MTLVKVTITDDDGRTETHFVSQGWALELLIGYAQGNGYKYTQEETHWKEEK